MDIRRDERGLITSWLVKIVIGMAVVALILFDGGSIAVNYFGLSSTAGDIAVSIATTLEQQPDLNRFTGECGKNGSGPVWCAQAAQLAAASDAKLVSASIDQTGVVHIKIKRVAHTLIVSHIGPISHWAKAVADGQSGTK
jgi:hypothetical protein